MTELSTSEIDRPTDIAAAWGISSEEESAPASQSSSHEAYDLATQWMEHDTSSAEAIKKYVPWPAQTIMFT